MIARLIAIGAIAAHTLALAPQVRDAAPAPANPATGTVTLSGVVITDDPSSRPLRRAVVTLAGGTLGGDRRTATDDQGRFAFSGLAAGRYTLSAAKAGWLTAYYGSKRPGRPAYAGAPIDATPGQSIAGLTMRMLHGSAITGVILDQTGRPASANVRLLQIHVQNGERTFEAAAVSYAIATTDDRGVYRLYGIPPGEYVVAAAPNNFMGVDNVYQATPDPARSDRPSPPDARAGAIALPAQGPTVTCAPVYFPGTTNIANAVPLSVGRAEEKSGIDLSLQIVPTAQISGVLLLPSGQAASGGQIRLVSHAPGVDSDGFGGGGAFFSSMGDEDHVTLTPEGKFSISSVAPGDYTIVARAGERAAVPAGPAGAGPAGANQTGPMGRAGRGGQPNALTLWAMADVSVNGQDLPNVALTLQPGMTIAGHLRFDGTAASPDLSRTRVALVPTGSVAAAVPPAPVDANGAFSFSAVAPGRYRVAIPAPPAGWSLASAVVGGRDAVDVPFEVHPGENVPDVVVRLADRTAEISGTLLDAAGKPASGYVVVVFSSDRAMWAPGGRRVRSPVVPDRDGLFRMAGLPPGEYCIAVATDLDPNDLRDTSVLEELAATSVRVSVAEGEKKVQNLKIGGR